MNAEQLLTHFVRIANVPGAVPRPCRLKSQCQALDTIHFLFIDHLFIKQDNN